MKSIILGLTLAFSSLSFAGANNIDEAIAGIDQSYGKLDIKEIISQTDLSGLCGVRRAELVYLDHQNQKHALTYLANDECRNERL